jgi:uncharacterized Zn ribbon protein
MVKDLNNNELKNDKTVKLIKDLKA